MPEETLGQLAYHMENEISCRFIASTEIKSRWVGDGNVRKFRVFIGYRELYLWNWRGPGLRWPLMYRSHSVTASSCPCSIVLWMFSSASPVFNAVTVFCSRLAVFTRSHGHHLLPPRPMFFSYLGYM